VEAKATRHRVGCRSSHALAARGAKAAARTCRFHVEQRIEVRLDFPVARPEPTQRLPTGGCGDVVRRLISVASVPGSASGGQRGLAGPVLDRACVDSAMRASSAPPDFGCPDRKAGRRGRRYTWGISPQDVPRGTWQRGPLVRADLGITSAAVRWWSRQIASCRCVVPPMSPPELTACSRRIEHAKLELALGVTPIWGWSGSGKTSPAEAIFLIGCRRSFLIHNNYWPFRQVLTHLRVTGRLRIPRAGPRQISCWRGGRANAGSGENAVRPTRPPRRVSRFR
jgi:hypothetical protein